MRGLDFARPFVFRFGALALAVTLLGACGGDDGPSGPGGDEIAEQWLEAIEAEDGSVQIVGGAAPDESGGPEVGATLTGSFITGGTTQLAVAGDAFDGLIITLGGVDGYAEVDFDSDRSAAGVAITLYGDLPDSEFTLQVAGTSGDQVGSYTEIPVTVVQVGSTGPIQVSVSWDTESDVDLHVIDPDGEEVYYGASVSSTGGELDLDSNAGCSIDGVNNENITWDDDASPVHGQYTVRVDYWDSCDSGNTSYIVTVRVDGEPTRTYNGVLSGTGTHGGAGAGELVATFPY